ncbi:hypothetical protein M4578_16790 [Salipiger sp. P9]|uniref:hypothetical protein n=1 Tax=Salipiger pentaromativorans TaxID=2943193 RepID=UPI0021582C9D|nr:hypothetical protein [Salipiger pentaromativorans]MCR8549489.1 hypothetical protein [Salipiger pentaromativorans]
MNAMQVSHYAHALYRSLGKYAEVEAAKRVRENEAAGKSEEARQWRAIQASIRSKRGPLQA